MSERFTGVVVEESLTDNRAVNELTIRNVTVTDEDDPVRRWHVYTVSAEWKDIERLSVYLRRDWHTHFWNREELVIVYGGRILRCCRDEADGPAAALSCGLTAGVPPERLLFQKPDQSPVVPSQPKGGRADGPAAL